MSRRRARSSSASTSSISSRLAAKKRWRVSQSPSTSALRMNRSRREHRVELAVGDGAPGDDRQPVERHPLGGHDLRALLLPARLVVGALEQVPGERLDPARVDARHRPAPQPRLVSTSSLTIIQAGWPLTPLPGQSMNFALRAPVYSRRPASLSPRWESRPERIAWWISLRLGGRVVDLDADLLGRLAQLADEVLPLADAQVVQELGLGLLAELVDADSSARCSCR